MHRSTVKKQGTYEFLKKQDSHHLLYDVLYKTILTEKTTQLELTQNTMSFFVAPWADKKLIAEFITKVFKTKVISVRVLNTKSKIKTFQGKKYEKKTFKKAIIRVESIKQASANFNNFLNTNNGVNNE